MNNMKDMLKTLGLPTTGKYENKFYVIPLEDSDDYARMYTLLSKNAVNTEFPTFEQNTNNSTTKITNYFEFDFDNITYNIFLFANFDEDKYYLKIGEK